MVKISSQHVSRGVIAITLTLLLCVSSVAGVVTSGPQDDMPANMSEDHFIKSGENVSVWDRAIFSLRVDPSNGATVIDNANVFVSAPDSGIGDVPLGKQKLAVFNANAVLTLNFTTRTNIADTEGFSGTKTELLVARIKGKPSTVSGSTSEMTTAEIQKLLTDEDINENVEFELVDAGEIDSKGDLTVNYNLDAAGTARGPGQYMFFLVQEQSGNGFEVSADGKLSIDGQSRILGVDTAAVQGDPTIHEINKTSVVPGEELEVDVLTNLTGDTHDQVFVVYHEETFMSSTAVIRVPSELEKETTMDQITVESDIKSLNGSAWNQKPITIGGTTIGNGHVEGSTTVSNVVDFLADRSNTTLPETKATGNKTLNGLILVSARKAESGRVYFTPKDDWKRGTYRYIYLTGSNSTTNFATATGTFELTDPEKEEDGEREDGNNDGSSSGGSSGGGGGGADTANPINKPEVSINPNDGSASIDIKTATTVGSVNAEFSDPVRGADTSLNGIEFEFSEIVFDFGAKATALIERPSEITEDPQENTLSYFSIDISGATDDDIKRANIMFSVNDSKLEEIGADHSEVHLYRYHNSQWQELETTHLGTGNYTAETPGFSVFAVGISEQTQTTSPESETNTETGAGDEAENVTTPENGSSDSTETTSEETKEDGSSWPFAIVILLIVVVVAVGTFYYRREQRQ